MAFLTNCSLALAAAFLLTTSPLSHPAVTGPTSRPAVNGLVPRPAVNSPVPRPAANGPVPRPAVNPPSHPSMEALVSYFSSGLESESEHLTDPMASWYKETLPADSIAAYRQWIWNAWKEANAGRLKQDWPEVAQNGWKDSIEWALPDGKHMLFAVLKKGHRPGGGYPLFINLHGGGCFPNEPGPWTSSVNNSEWRAAKILGSRYKDTPSLYFVPRMPDDRRGRWYNRSAQAAFIRAWQLGVLSGDIDPNRTYIMGISEGGYGSFRMGPFFADYFAGAGPMAGAVDTNQVPAENLRNTAFRVEVGQNDFAYGRALFGHLWQGLLDSLGAAHPGQFPHAVVVQGGKGHGIDYFNTAPWLSGFTRNVYPDTLSFAYYPVYDTINTEEKNVPFTYRKGFGYIRLDGLSGGGTNERSFYVEKKGNIYHILSADKKGIVTGTIRLYVDKVDFSSPVSVYYNGRLVQHKKLVPSAGVMAESLALFGDPARIFAAEVVVPLTKA